MGYVAYDFEFVEAGSGGGPASGGLNALREMSDSGVALVALDTDPILDGSLSECRIRV